MRTRRTPAALMRYLRLLLAWLPASACGQSRAAPQARSVGAGNPGGRAGVEAEVRGAVDSAGGEAALAYAGVDDRGIPHYTTRAFSAEERSLLRRVYGIEDPNRLYVSDSTDEGLLKYDTRRKTCRTYYVDSYRVGFVSVRRPGESWEEAERRVRATPLRDFPPSAHEASTSIAALDPAIQADVAAMLAAARAAGFRLRVKATYRSPEREAYLMAAGPGRTYTLTSMHQYGRAIDVVIGDGNLRRAGTRRQWTAFRRWVTHFHDGEFRILGRPDRTWDWPHIEVPSPDIGFSTIEAAIERARRCDVNAQQVTSTSARPCNFAPHLSSGSP